MPNPLAIAAGAAEGLEKAAQNIYKIQQAKGKLKKDSERFDMDMKIKKLQLQKVEDELSPEKVKLGYERLQLENKVKKSTLDFNTQKIDTALSEENRKKETFEGMMGEHGGLEVPPGGSVTIGGYTQRGPAQQKERTSKDLYIDDIVTRMQAGEEVSPEERKLAGAYVKPKEEKNFDNTITEEVLGKLVDPNKSDEDFDEDLQDLMDNRKSYEDAGVDVTDIFKRAQQRAPAKVNKIQKFLKDWL